MKRPEKITMLSGPPSLRPSAQYPYTEDGYTSRTGNATKVTPPIEMN